MSFYYIASNFHLLFADENKMKIRCEPPLDTYSKFDFIFKRIDYIYNVYVNL